MVVQLIQIIIVYNIIVFDLESQFIYYTCNSCIEHKIVAYSSICLRVLCNKHCTLEQASWMMEVDNSGLHIVHNKYD